MKQIAQQIMDSRLMAPLLSLGYALSDMRLRRSGWKSNYGQYCKNPNRPVWIEIEVTNICNANCTFCGYQFQERPKVTMGQALFEQIIDQYCEMGGGDIQLTPVVGDALVDKHFVDKVRYARSKPNIKGLFLTTNAILLSPDRFEELAEAGITDITISISGLDPDEYKRVYRKDQFMRVYEQLCAIAESPHFSRIPVTLSLRSETFRTRKTPYYHSLVAKGFRISRIVAYDNWGGRIRSQNLTGSMLIKPNRPGKHIPCSVLYDGPMIFADGRMTACGCRDLNADSDLSLGKFQDTGLQSPYRDGHMDKIRTQFKSGNLPDICKDCRHYRPAW